jgi:hypothetical protein
MPNPSTVKGFAAFDECCIYAAENVHANKRQFCMQRELSVKFQDNARRN